MIKFDLGEKKNVWIEVSERDNAAFTITEEGTVFEVFDEDGVSVQASATATVEGAKVYGLVDTTATVGEGEEETDVFVAGKSYEVKFTFIINDETYIDVVHIKLEETRL